MRIRRTLTCACLVAGLFCGDMAAADDAQALLEAGRRFTAELKLNPEADARLFQAAGLDRAQALLSAVMSQGQTPGATVEDWANTHRATAGLVELFVQKGELQRASMFAYMQSIYYRNFEGDRSSALEASRQELDLQRKSGSLEGLDIAWSEVGSNLRALGRLDEALESFRQAQSAGTEPYANRSARTWRDIVQGELARKRPADAARELERFLDLARSAPPYYRAQALMAQSDARFDAGEYGGALESIGAARQAMKGDPKADDLDYEAVNSLMTGVLDSMNVLPYAEAMALAKRIDTEFPGLPLEIGPWAELSLRTRRRLAGDIDGVLREDTARLEQGRRAGNVYLQIEALRSLATTYRSFHSVANEIAALEASVALERSLLPADGLPANRVAAREWARGLIQLGESYAEARQIAKARRMLDEAIQGMDRQTAAATKANLASMRARAVLGQARVAELDDDADTARGLLEAALKEGGAYDRSDVLLQLARLERAEHPDQAEKYYEDAIVALDAARNRPWGVIVRLEAARLLALQGKLEAAHARVAEAATGAAAANFADAGWRAKFVAGLIAEKQGADEEAVKAYGDAIARLEAIRAGLGQQEQRQSLADNEAVTELYQRMVAVLTRLGRRDEAWRTVERGKARAFAEGLQGRRFRETVPPAAAPQLAEIEKRILSLRVQLAPQNESIVRGAGREPAVLRSLLDQAEAQFALARQQAGLASSRGSQAVKLEPPPFRALQAKLPANTALVEYFLLADSVTAFVVTRRSVQQVVWKADAKALRGDVLRLRALLSDGNSEERLKPLLAKVSEAVWKPVSPKLPAAVSRLVIVPAGYLNYLPFQVLEMTDGRAVIERYAVSYLPSASTLLLLGEAPPMSRDLFLGALGNVSVDGWAPLPGTLRESEGIGRIFPEAVKASGNMLTHDEAVSALEHHREVHFATHGLLDQHAPLFSALLLSPAEGQPARLSLYELMDMNVQARLVVLSACETGLGQLLGGDEVAGLTRTILSAGASTVVSSLWKVSDDSTALLMQEFYRRLRARARVTDALRGAALEVRKQYPHPFYWAPFLVTGAM
jgi:CHAT domain-containing protein